jgi:hypothetical protein
MSPNVRNVSIYVTYVAYKNFTCVGMYKILHMLVFMPHMLVHKNVTYVGMYCVLMTIIII